MRHRNENKHALVGCMLHLHITFFKLLHVFHETMGGTAHIFKHTSRIFGGRPQNNSNVHACFVPLFFSDFFTAFLIIFGMETSLGIVSDIHDEMAAVLSVE